MSEIPRAGVIDVLIVGAGPAGSATAALLAKQGRDVLLVDRAPFPRDKTCGDGLTPRAVGALDRLGLLPTLEARGYQRITGARVTVPDGGTFSMRFTDYDFGLPAFGMVVPRYELDDLLRQHALAAGAHFTAPAHVLNPLSENGRVVGVVAGLAGERRELRARLTVIATGASISLLRALGLVREMPPGVNAARGYFHNVSVADDAFAFYFQRDLPRSYAWIFPLGEGRANVGVGFFGRRKGIPAPLSQRLLAQFVAGQPDLRGARADGPVQGFPLRVDFPSHPPAGDGFLVVGEALGLVHPVTGEGIDLALESAELAAQVAGRALVQGDTSRAALAPYAQLLGRRYTSFFLGARGVGPIATRPGVLNRLVRRARTKPYLGYLIAGITMGTVSPWRALDPRVWLDVLAA